MDDKVTNPLTKRIINIDGAVFKKLLKDDPNIIFSPEDRKKIRAKGFKVKSPEPVAAEPGPSKPGPSKLVPAKSSSSENSAKSGPSKPAPACSKYEEPPLSPDDLGMHEPKSVPKDSTMTKLDKVPKAVEKKVEKHLAIKKHDLIYIDDGHMSYCKNKIGDDLLVPLIKNKISYSIPYSICNIRSLSGFQNYIGASKLPYVKRFDKALEYTFNNYNKYTAMQLFKNQEHDLDFIWFNQLDEYVTKLSTYDAFTVLGYSYHSFDWINKYLIGQLNKTNFYNLLRGFPYTTYYFPYYVQAYGLLKNVKIMKDIDVNVNGKTQKVSAWVQECIKIGVQKSFTIFCRIMPNFDFEWWKEVMELYKKDFKRIIDSAPPVKKDTVVYRGVKDDYFLKGAKNNYYKNTCFVSCTLSPYHALLYLRGQQCCFKRITLLPGTKVLFISGLSCYPNELEIVINVDSTLYIQETSTVNIYDNIGGDHNAYNDVCFDNTIPKRKVDVSEILVGA